jgi:hypothetical protein
MTARDQALATYAQFGAVDPALAGYSPKWLNTMTDDVILEGSMFDGVIQGRDAVRNVVITIRACYERQQHKFAGETPAGFVENYAAVVRGEPIGCVLLAFRNAEGKTDRVVASYRPRSALELLSGILREKFAGQPYADQFGPGADE